MSNRTAVFKNTNSFPVSYSIVEFNDLQNNPIIDLRDYTAVIVDDDCDHNDPEWAYNDHNFYMLMQRHGYKGKEPVSVNLDPIWEVFEKGDLL